MRKNKILASAGTVLGCVLALVVFTASDFSSLLLPWEIGTGRLNPAEKQAAITAVWELALKTAGGLAVVVGLFIAWYRSKAAMITARATLEAAQASREGQITERFTRAIDQLGAIKGENGDSPNIEVRLGGIYALEQIAKDDPEKFHLQIFEVLTARFERMRLGQLTQNFILCLRTLKGATKFQGKMCRLH